MKKTIKNNHSQSGASLVEAIFVLPLFLIIVFGMLEMTFVYKAKNTLNLATSEAARKGSFHHAQLSFIEDAFSEGMAPLYVRRSTCKGFPFLKSAGSGCAKTIQDSMKNVGKQTAITIISPTEEIFKAFKKELKVEIEGSKKKTNWVIPNDNLKWRPTETKSVKILGKNRPINIQDANLLKIKTYWCQKLSVPGLDRIFYNLILRHSESADQKRCNKLSLDHSGSSVTKEVFGLDRGYYIALRSHAVTRMQSPVSKKDLLTSSKIQESLNPTISSGSDAAIDESKLPVTGGGTGSGITDLLPPIDDGNGCDPSKQSCIDEPPSCNPDTDANCMCEIG